MREGEWLGEGEQGTGKSEVDEPVILVGLVAASDCDVGEER